MANKKVCAPKQTENRKQNGYCLFFNQNCGKDICCAFCASNKCEFRCKDENKGCKYAREQGREQIPVKTQICASKSVRVGKIKKWDKDKIKA